jgi:hypothetical protein
MEDVIIKYSADVSDLARARTELGLNGAAQEDLVEQFRHVNAEAAKQTKLLAEIAAASKGGTQAVDSEVKQVGKLAQMLEKINVLKRKKNDLDDDESIAALNKEIQALEREFHALDTSGTDALENIGGGAKKANGETGFLGKTLGQIGPLIAGAFAVDKLIAFATETIRVSGEFQKFRAILVNTYEGNERAADAALASIVAFGAKTPFSVAEITDSFIKLQGAGIVPTTKLLTQLGDVAASKGKTFDELTEAILDAQTFEFERLKEFGVKASVAGEKVTFTFKNQKTTVDKTGEAVLKYVRGLGDVVGVSGSMAAISGTLNGQLSNLGDSTDQLFLSIGKLSGGVINGAVAALGSLVTGTTGLIKALGEKDLAQNNSIAQNRNEAQTAQYLLDRYRYLTANGVKPTATEQAELNKIVIRLRDSLGESVVELDKETKAFKLNQKAVEDQIRQRLLLANQEAGTLALQYRNADVALQTQAETSKALRAEIATRNEVITAMGLTAKQAVRLGYLAKENALSEADANKYDVKALIGYMEAQDRLAISESRIAEYHDIRAKKLAALEKAGFSMRDVERLFTAALDDEAKAFQETTTKTTEQAKALDLLAKAEKAVKDAQAQPANTEKELAARNDRVKTLEAEVTRLKALTNAYVIPFKVAFTPPTEADFQALDDLQRADREKRAAEAQAEKEKGYQRDAQRFALFLGANKAAELAELKNSLESGQLTREQYLVKRAAVEKKYQVEALKANVDTIQKELQDLQISGDRRLELQKELQAAQAALYDADVDKFSEAQQKKAAIEQQLRQDAFAAGVQLIDNYFAAQKQSLDDQLTALQQQHDYELTLAGDTKGAKEKIDAAYNEKAKAIQREQADLARKQAIFNKALAIGQIAVNTALGITKVIAEVPKFDFGISTALLIAAYAALGALQAGVVLSTPVAKFNKGTDWVKGGTPGLDSVYAMLTPGERVITADVNRDYYGSLSAIHRREIPADALAQFVTAYKVRQFSPAPIKPSAGAAAGGGGDQAFQDQLLAAIAERPVLAHVYDEKGHTSYLERKGSRRQSKNARHSFGG